MTVHLLPGQLPQRPGDDPVSSFISAMLIDGTYDPAHHGFTDQDLITHSKVHHFCTSYQSTTGRAPTPEAVARKFPEFPFDPTADMQWAPAALREEVLNKRLRWMMTNASNVLMKGSTHEAIDVIVDGLSRLPRRTKQALDAFDLTLYDIPDTPGCPVAGTSLMNVTGGIKPGELWYVGALSNVGKSWELARHAVTAVAAGWNVVLFSLEMGGRRLILKRIHQIIIGRAEPDVARRKELISKWKAVPGRGELKVIDPSIETVIDNRVIESYAKPNTLLMVDHVGLMYTTKGNASIEDHSFAAAISAKLKNTALTKEIPIIAAAQLNATAEESNRSKNDTEGGRKRPVLTQLAQSIALGQDADVVYFLRGEQESAVRECRMVKNRDGEFAPPWFLHFMPGHGLFTEISLERARTMLSLERDHKITL